MFNKYFVLFSSLSLQDRGQKMSKNSGASCDALCGECSVGGLVGWSRVRARRGREALEEKVFPESSVRYIQIGVELPPGKSHTGSYQSKSQPISVAWCK